MPKKARGGWNDDFASSKVKDTEPTEAWAEVSYDTPPSIWNVAYYRQQLRRDLRHIRVLITPIDKRAAPKEFEKDK